MSTTPHVRSQPTAQPVIAARPRQWRRALTIAAALASVTCGGGDAVDAPAVLHGQVWCGGPVAGATVRVYQLVDGEQLGLLAEEVTGSDGRFEARAAGYEHLLVVADGGRFVDVAGATITIPAGQGLRSIARDVIGGEARELLVTPLTDVLVGLVDARAAAGEPFNEQALPRVYDRLTAHLDFDPARTPIADLGGPLAAGADAAQHALVLRGLGEIAAQAAADLRVTAQDVSTLSIALALRADATSVDARLDGNVGPDGAAPLHLGATCPADAPGARASCRITSNTLRSELAGGVLRFLARDQATGLIRADVLGWVSAIAANVDGELFAGDAPQPPDRVGPRITWGRPAVDATLAGTIVVELTAEDEVGVDTVDVALVAVDAAPDAPPLATIADTDPARGRFVGNLDTIALIEGAAVLRATARDLDGNATTSTRAVTINNISGGTISGVVVKGRVDGATVKVYAYAAGAPGLLLGQGTTAADGTFTNLALADGYAGPLLIEAGFGGSYAEEAGPATVTFDVADALRTIVPSYADGGAPTGVVLSPLTSFAVAYRSQLAAAANLQDVPGQWPTATAAIQGQFGVANILAVVPLRPEEMTTLTAGARYGLVLVGLSELARRASTLGGGDAGTFGVAASALKVYRLWQLDLADGCWNGRSGAAADAPRLYYGGTQALGDDPVRRGLADAVAGYITSNRNASPFAAIADVLPLLDDLATGGAATATGACPGGTLVPATTATGFDQQPPVITVTPALVAGADPIVRGAVPVVALAVDPDGLDPRPTLRVTGPAGFVDRDDDGDATDADVRFTVDTIAAVGAEGTLDLAFESFDDSTNRGTATRRLIIDNAAPVVTITGVVDGDAYPPPRVITYDVVDSHLASVTATLDGAPFVSGAAVLAPGLHTLTVVARDVPGNATTATRTFRIDGVAPVITVTGVTAGGFHQPPVTVGFSAADVDLAGVTATLDGAAFASGTVVDAEGPHALLVTAVDHAGNQAELPVAFTLDSIDPVISIAGVDHLGVHVPPRIITFDAVDANLLSVTATVDGAAFVSGAAVSAVGDHVLIVTARDKAGHQVTATRAFAIDNTGPLVAVTGVVDNGFHQPPVTLGFTAMDPHLASLTATLDGLPIVTGTLVPTEGPHDLLVVAVDLAGNRTEVPRHFTLDGTAPIVTLVPDLQDGGFYPRQPAVNFTAADLNLLSVTATLDGQPFNTGNAIAIDGPHALRVTAIDKAGNSTLLARDVTIDGVAPVVNVAGVVDGGFYRPGTVVTFTQVDTNPGTLSATLDGAPFASGAALGGPDGPRTLVVTAVDQAGNPSERTFHLTLDGTPPTVTLVPDLQDGGFYPRQAAVAFAGADVNLLSVTATLDGQPFNTGNAIAGDGPHTLRVTALDKAGNSTLLTRTFTIDGVAPVINVAGVVDGGFYRPGTVVTFTQVDTNPDTLTATLDGAPFASGAALVGPDGPRLLVVTAVDRAGNQTERTFHLTLDGTDPVPFTNPALVDLAFYQPILNLQFGANDANLLSVTATLDGAPFANNGAIAGDGSHTLVVSALDKAGNSASLPRTFTIDGTRPVVTIGVVADGGFYRPGVRPTFAIVETHVATVTATITSAAGTIPFASGDAVPGPDGPRTLDITVIDKAGNQASASVTFVIDGTDPVPFTNPALVDLAFYQPIPNLVFGANDANLQSVTATLDGQPFASNGAIAGDGSHTLVVSALDKAGNSKSLTRTVTIDGTNPVITFGVVADGGFYKPGVRPTFAIIETNVATVTATITSAAGTIPFASGDAVLGADGLRTIDVNVVDKAGNATPASISFTLDNTNPVPFTNPALVDLAFYQPIPNLVFGANDANLQSVTATLDGQPFANNGPIAGDGSHTLVVSALDKAGNSASLPRTFTIDGTRPVITFGVVAADGFYKPGIRPTFTIVETNVATVTATITSAAGTIPFASGDPVAGADGLRTLDINVVDKAGNPGSATISFTVDGTPPNLSVDGVANGGIYQPPRQITFAVSDDTDPLATVTAVLDGNAFASGNSVVANGPHLLGVMARDRAGNETPMDIPFKIDGVDPVVTIAGVANNAFYKPGAATVTFSQQDDNPGPLVGAINGIAIPSPTVIAGADGLRALLVSTTDLAGNPGSLARTFYVDGTPPTLALTATSHPGPWVRGTYQLTVVADDGLAASGSLGADITVTAAGANGAIAPLVATPSVLPGGKRQLQVSYDTAVAGTGPISVTFNVVDRATNAAVPLVVAATVDNTAPDVTIQPVRNLAPPQVDGFINDAAATLRGTVAPPGGAPTSVTITINNPDLAQPLVGAVNPDAAGAWVFTSPALAASVFAYSVTTSVVDAAGNADLTPAAASFRVDRTGPTVTLDTSPIFDEALRCTVTVNVDSTNSASAGAITNQATPVAYNCANPSTDLAGAGVSVSKYVSRLDDPALNPLRWRLSTIDDASGVQVANAGATVQFRLYRQGQPAPNTWVAGVATGFSVTTLDAYVDALAAAWPELLTHTAAFVIELRAQDRLGNWGPTVTRTWNHRPLAPPVSIISRGEAPRASADPLFPYSMFRNSLNPDVNQQGMGDAMSGQFGGQIAVDAPRGLYVFDVFNPHPTAINVGFFLPVVNNANYTKRVWDTSPWVSSADTNLTTMVTPALGLCGWRASSWKALVAHNPRYNCNTKACLCDGAGWNPPTDSTPSTVASTGALPDGILSVRAINLAVAQGQLLPRQNLSLNINTAGGERPFFEYVIPPRIDAGTASRIRIIIAMDLSFFAPYTNASEGIEESDGPDAESYALPGGFTPLTTSSYYERWAECKTKDSGNATLCLVAGAPSTSNGIGMRRRVRTLVEARVQIPQLALSLNARARAANAVTSSPDVVPRFNDGAGTNTQSFLWDTCEANAYVAHGSNPCSPVIPTTNQSQ